MFNNIPPSGFPQIDLSQDVKRINAEISGMASDCTNILTDITAETATVTGNPISLSDALATDAISVVAEIEPEQDLHGYDKPWSGGSGKNKLPLVLADIKSANIGGTWNGNIYTWYGSTFEILQDPDGNVTGVKVGGINSGVACQLVIPVGNLDGDYYFCGCADGGANDTYNVLMWDRTTSERVKKWDGTTNTDTSTDLTTPRECKLVSGHSIEYRIRVMTNANVNNVICLPMIVSKTETDFTFEPYTNICPISGMDSVTVTTTDGTDTNTATASLGTTIYGGSVDMVEGSGSVDRAVVDLGTLTWTYDATNVRFYSDVVDNAVALSDGLCTAYPVIQTADFTQPNSLFISSTKRINITDTIYTDATSFKTWLTDNNIKLVYPLATPTTLSLTPTTLAMLDGENTISTDAEEVSIEYIKSTLVGRVRRLEEEQ